MPLYGILFVTAAVCLAVGVLLLVLAGGDQHTHDLGVAFVAAAVVLGLLAGVGYIMLEVTG